MRVKTTEPKFLGIKHALFSIRQGYLPKVGFEKMALKKGDSRDNRAQKLQDWGISEGCGYLGTGQNISELLGRTSYQGEVEGIGCGT